MKKLIIAVSIVGIIFLIYLGFINQDTYYLSLGDGLAMGSNGYQNENYGFSNHVKDYLETQDNLKKFVTQFNEANYRTTDLTVAIKNNKKAIIDGKEKTLQNALIKADIVTLAIGQQDLYAKIKDNIDINANDLYKHFDQVIADLDVLLNLMRSYCKEQIIMIGYYNRFGSEYDELFTYLNQRVKGLTDKYKIVYLEPNYFKETIYFDSEKDIYPNSKGYEKIGKEIINILNAK